MPLKATLARLDPFWRPVTLISGIRVRARRGTGGWGRVRAQGWYELETDLFLAAVLRPGDTVVDVGANEGVVSVQAALVVGPRGRVLAVEPDRRLASAARRACRRNRVRNVEVVEAFTGDGGELAVDRGAYGYAVAARGGRVVPTVTVDDLVAERGLKPALLKVDVDGPEAAVLRGAEGTIRSHRPSLVVELSAGEDAAAGGWHETLGLARSLGYSTYASRMKFARVLPVEDEGDLRKLPVRFERGDVANLFCTPEPLSEADRERIWPARFVPPAYVRHYLSDSPYPSPAAFWADYAAELRAAAGR